MYLWDIKQHTDILELLLLLMMIKYLYYLNKTSISFLVLSSGGCLGKRQGAKWYKSVQVLKNCSAGDYSSLRFYIA